MAEKYISVEFTYPIPDAYRSTEFTQGKTGTFTYVGPEFLTFEIDNISGKESGWCIWEEKDLERPCPADCTRVTVDCKEEPLLCEIANDSGSNDQVEFRRFRPWGIMYQAPEGYPSIEEPLEYEPRDIYDEFNITYDFDNGEFNIPVKDWASQGVELNLTWEQLKKVRNEELHGSDGKIAPDAPESLKTEWMEYRQKLRDLPQKMQDAGLDPWQAAAMFPLPPKDMDDPTEADDPNDPFRASLGDTK